MKFKTEEELRKIKEFNKQSNYVLDLLYKNCLPGLSGGIPVELSFGFIKLMEEWQVKTIKEEKINDKARSKVFIR